MKEFIECLLNQRPRISQRDLKMRLQQRKMKAVCPGIKQVNEAISHI